MPVDRRRVLKSLTLAGLAAPLAFTGAPAQAPGLVPDGASDQTAALQAAIDTAARQSGHLILPAGTFRTTGLRLPSHFSLAGVPGATVLVHLGTGPLLHIADQENITVTGIGLDGADAGGDIWRGGLVHIEFAHGITLRDCTMRNTQLNGISLLGSSGRLEACTVSHSALTGIFVSDAEGVAISGNIVRDCANGGIRVWRGASGPDGTLVLGNRVSGIGWAGGGNGQNGNGINIFRADGVIVADNHIAGCAFSAIRLNATHDTQVRGNTCLDSGEVAIFSEFGFSGSVIASNIVDGAAAGISMTNYNEGGRLAVCTGNIVRNILAASPVNPDTFPYGIAAEADAVVSANVVEAVPGVGILAGWGPYLRDVSITNNLVRDVETGIAVSVVEGAGRAVVSGNLLAQVSGHALVGNRWHETASNDLARDAAHYPRLTIAGNVAGG